MSFMDEMQAVINDEKTLTDNGAVAYRTAGSELMDFNFAVTAMRNESEDSIKDKFAKVFYEDRLTAVKYLFYVGDVRGGLGERRTFRACMDWLASNQPDIAKALLGLIPSYTRWDNLCRMIDNDEVTDDVAAIIKEVLETDVKLMNEGHPVSLLGKWLPSQNASSKETRRLGTKIASKIGMTPREYRKTLTALRKYIDVVEVKMSSGRWNDIKYEAVPSRANLIYNKAFLEHDEARRKAYLDSLSRGETKINAGVLNPHEIVHKYTNGCTARLHVDNTLEELWKALPDLSVENTLIVRDGSGSMTWGGYGDSTSPLDVATALAIYMAEHNSGEWRDKFITFSSRPKIVDLSGCQNLREKVDLSLREADCSNTNIYATMMLVLRTAVEKQLFKDEMPQAIIICSDMQFDGRAHNMTGSLFDEISREYSEQGYQMPRIIFWNLSGRVNQTVPMQHNDLGLVLCSGFSVQLLKMFMSGKTDPFEILLEQLDGERYLPVAEAVKDII